MARGGKREGAGRPSGSTELRIVPPIEMDGLDITEAQRTFAAYRAAGLTTPRVCDILGISNSTGYRWGNADWMPVACETARQKMLGGDAAVLFREMLPQAIEAYVDALGPGQKITTRRNTAADIFDRTFGKPVTTERSYSMSDVNIVVQVSNAEIEQYIEGEYEVL